MNDLARSERLLELGPPEDRTRARMMRQQLRQASRRLEAAKRMILRQEHDQLEPGRHDERQRLRRVITGRAPGSRKTRCDRRGLRSRRHW